MEIFLALLGSAVIAALVSALVSVLTTERGIAAVNVIQERKNWRDKIRELAVEVQHALVAPDPSNANQFRELGARMSLLVNPHEDMDQQIVQLIQEGNAGRADEFTHRLELLLKHDWERAKREASLRRSLWEKPPERFEFENYVPGQEHDYRVRRFCADTPIRNPGRRPPGWLSNARNIVRWVGVSLSVASVAFAVLSYSGFWYHVWGDDLLDALANRLDTSYATDVPRHVRPPEPEWRPLMRVIRTYSHADLPKDREPVVFARRVAVASAKSDVGEWTAPTTPMALVYDEHPTGAGQNIWDIGTLGDLHEWVRRDQADFDVFWGRLIFGALSACIGFFLALPEKR